VNKEAEEALLANVKSITDRLDMVDEVFKQLRVGRKMTLVFQCGHSGLYLPGDYVKNWGRDYGIGLGPHPVSEVLDTDYHTDPPAITSETQSIEQIMHPVGNSFAQVDHMLVDEDVAAANMAVLAVADPYMRKRAAIVRGKQLQNPKSKLRNMAVAWDRAGRNLQGSAY